MRIKEVSIREMFRPASGTPEVTCPRSHGWEMIVELCDLKHCLYRKKWDYVISSF